MALINIGDVEKQAYKEMREEREKQAIKELKAKMKQIEQAQLIVRNLQRELEVLKEEIGDRA